MELEKEVNTILGIYFRARQSFEVYKYLSKENDQSPFWLQIMYLSIKDTILELDKLFSTSPRHKFRLSYFFQKFKSTGDFNSYNFDQLTLSNWEHEQKSFSPQLIRLVNNLRNNHFAHTGLFDPTGLDPLSLDPLSIDYRSDIDNTKIDELFDFVKKVLCGINTKCLGIDLEPALLVNEKDIHIFDRLKELNRYQADELIEQINQSK
jgi:hypothetical protein